jgi:hypothetical protein
MSTPSGFAPSPLSIDSAEYFQLLSSNFDRPVKKQSFQIAEVVKVTVVFSASRYIKLIIAS